MGSSTWKEWNEHALFTPTPRGRAGLSFDSAPWALQSLAKPLALYETEVVIEAETRLVYTSPPNTSLVLIHGPARALDGYGKSVGACAWVCAAKVNPPPPWAIWANGTSKDPTDLHAFQIAPDQVHNSTLFIIPLNPTVRYSVEVSGSGNTACALTGVTTYPFHV